MCVCGDGPEAFSGKHKHSFSLATPKDAFTPKGGEMLEASMNHPVRTQAHHWRAYRRMHPSSYTDARHHKRTQAHTSAHTHTIAYTLAGGNRNTEGKRERERLCVVSNPRYHHLPAFMCTIVATPFDLSTKISRKLSGAY